MIYFCYFYDYDEMVFTWRILRRGDSYLDGGANIGTYSLLAAAAMQCAGRIDSFEPNAVARRRLAEAVERNHLTDVINVHHEAIGGASGYISFTDDADVSNRAVNGAIVGRVTVGVPVIALAAVLEERRYQMAKLDIEGYEYLALASAEPFLRSGNPAVIMLELIPHLLEDSGGSIEMVVDLLTRSGYGLHTYSATTGLLSSGMEQGFGNVLAIHESAAVGIATRLESSNPPPLS